MKLEEMLSEAGLATDLFKGEHWQKAGADILILLQQSATAFVKNNKDLAVTLTEAQVKGVLYNAIIKLPDLPDVPVGADADLLRRAADILLARMQGVQVISEAQRQSNQSLRQLEDNAKTFAINLGTIVLNGALSALATAGTSAAVSAISK
jgi:hypothetical protein